MRPDKDHKPFDERLKTGELDAVNKGKIAKELDLADQYKLKRQGDVAVIGLNYKDYVRLDFGSDRLIYDYPTGNWKVTLAVPNTERVTQLLSKR